MARPLVGRGLRSEVQYLTCHRQLFGARESRAVGPHVCSQLHSYSTTCFVAYEGGVFEHDGASPCFLAGGFFDEVSVVAHGIFRWLKIKIL